MLPLTTFFVNTRGRHHLGLPRRRDVPGSKTQSPSFMITLLGAWIAMGFRSPKLEVGGELHV